MHRAWLMSLILPLLAPPLCAADLYRLDSRNTHVSLDVRLFGVRWISARFEQLTGELAPGPRPDSGGSPKGRVDVTIQTASLRCDSARWNARLLSAAWFDPDRYPQIVYRSDRIDFDAEGGAMVSGHLTLHGQTRALTLLVNRWICGNHSGTGDSCSFDAHGRLQRSDYGLPHGLFEGGDEVEISIEGVAAGPKAVQSSNPATWR
jgi:polyisoprenoid-binding protein YceI